ncbi:type I restriction enzyme S subunit [Brevundimonas vesicularis]|uniref:Type I restriction enzyme S subunit n=2 Tax=Brevundimonas vesicularis TaxID=41276 RepID=A0A7W9FV05_BREVE|nr:type I restriction enzyme S subunit [Brevundimonas vesicularis]
MSDQYVDAGVPFLRSQDIRPGFIELGDLKYISPEFHKRLRKSRLSPGDVAIVRTGYPGTAAVIPGDLPDANCADLVIARPGPTLDARFLAFVLNSPWGKGQIGGRLVGAAQQHFNVRVAQALEIPFPPLETQRRIASILGAYDDLIEVNRRRVAVLEEMARGLFEEWFVRFRFPGHESAPLVDTPDGPRPQGWTRGQAKDVIAFDPKTKIPKDDDKPFIPMGHLDTVTSLIASPESRKGNSGAKFRNWDTLFARITPCLENGKTGLVRDLPGVNGIGFGSTEFIVMRGERSGPAFTYCLSRLPGFRDHARSSMSGATGRQRARTESVATYAMAIPASDDLFDRFESAAWPMLELVGKLGSMNERLATSRDLLLPRLISGQLSVEAAERDLELAA